MEPNRLSIITRSAIAFRGTTWRSGLQRADDPQIYESDLDRLRGHRVWVVLSHIHGVGAQESKHIEFYLDMLGPRLNSLSVAGAETYLYDLRNAAVLPAAQSQSAR